MSRNLVRGIATFTYISLIVGRYSGLVGMTGLVGVALGFWHRGFTLWLMLAVVGLICAGTLNYVLASEERSDLER